MNDIGPLFLILLGTLFGLWGVFAAITEKVKVGLRGLYVEELTGPVARWIGIIYVLGGGFIALSGLLSLIGGSSIPQDQSIWVVTIAFIGFLIANAVGMVTVRRKRQQ